MKALISLVLICGLWGQTASAPDTIWADCGVCTDSTIYNTISRWDWNKEYFSVVFLYLYEQYKTENIDTIKAIPFESEYIIDHGTYREMVTERQLEKRGYEYKYRWVIITDPLEFEYIWIKKQTLPGFMEWLKEKQ